MRYKNNKIMNFKKYLILFTFLILFNIFFVILNDSEVLGMEFLTLRAGVYENAPKIFIDDKSNVSGFWPDILEYVALQEGWQIEWVGGTWTQCLERLKNKEIDLMPDVSFTETRNKDYSFSQEIILVSWTRIYARKRAHIETILDLEGKRIGVLSGSVNFLGPEGIKEVSERFNIHCTFVEMNDYIEIFKALEKGEVDAGVTNKDFGNTYEKDFDIERTPIIFGPSHIQFALPKDSSLTPYLTEKIDFHIKELKENKDSIYYQLLEKWLTVKVAEKEVIPEWLNWILIGIGGISFLLFGGNILLRSQVNSKTKELRKEIIEHKIAENALREAHEQLEEKVDQRTKELQDANLKLQELDRLKSMFIASMSHELRTPLNSIIGFTGIILQGMSGEINQEQRKQLSLVKNSANHLLDLINDVIDISKIEADKVELYIQKFDLSLLAQEIKESFAVALEKKGLALLIKKPSTLLIESDERRIKQILVNFISNALKFTYKGEIEIKVVKKDKIVEVSVRDTGIGIKKEDVDKLFNAFSRIPNPGRIEEGTGLGLYLSQKIARLLGGNITAESEFEKGSIFTLTLPLKYKEAIR